MCDDGTPVNIETLPDPRTLARNLGVDAAAIRQVDTLSERHGHAIWRIVLPERSYVLKWLPETSAVEVEAYLLLQELGVPTLPLHAHSSQALLLEDLDHSAAWRLAMEADASREEVGRAVARWYRDFHRAGEALLAEGTCPGFLARETDQLGPDGILATGERLGLAGYAAFALAAEHLALFKAALEHLSLTLNYNDFYWTNLALSRSDNDLPEAIIYDYHLLGVGMRTSDCRNVTGSLSGAAVRAFWDTYGDVDPREETLDRPLATLFNLCAAARLPRLPRWAEASRASVVDGELEAELRAAIVLARELLG